MSPAAMTSPVTPTEKPRSSPDAPLTLNSSELRTGAEDGLDVDSVGMEILGTIVDVDSVGMEILGAFVAW